MMKEKRLFLRKFLNNSFVCVLILVSVIAIIPLLLIFFHIFTEGFSALKPSFFTNVPKPVGETGGGILHAIIGSLILNLTACIICLPFGIGAGIFLSETKKGFFPALVRFCVDILQSTPSIVIGIICYIWIVRPMSSFSAWSGAVALAILMLPVVIKSTEETLLLIPNSLREASFALGAPYYYTVLRVIVPAAASGIMTGILVSISRIAGETAPLLFTSFGSNFLEYSLSKPMSSLPHLIFTYSISPYDEWHSLAWSASLILISIILLLNIITKIIASKFRHMFHSM